MSLDEGTDAALESRLQAAGEAWRAAQPPVTLKDGALRNRRRRPHAGWLPAAAAAAVVAVVGAAALLPGAEREASPATPPVVPFRYEEPRESDVPSPRVDESGNLSSPASAPVVTCAAEQLTAALRATDEPGRWVVELAPRPGKPECDLPQPATSAALRWAGGSEWAQQRVAQQPAGPYAPLSGVGGMVHEPVLVDVVAERPVCRLGDPVAVELGGLVVPLEGRAVPTEACEAPAPQEVHVGVPYRAGQPHAVQPPDRGGLAVSIEDGSVVAEPDVRFVVRIENSTDTEVSLEPCPAYAVAVTWAPAGSPRGVMNGYSGQSGRLPCDALPRSVRPGQAVRVEMGLGDPWPRSGGGSPPSGAVRVVWGIAGTAPAHGSSG